ncbi:hypothetical protein QJS10_CPA05g01367 [Acorus calamus]|uniref:Replication protein A 70 kDa DNA-binding subunit B/D first OB fold domain-containing protein n=1 Tax=Acorus calamus TaxID=4465 RepID=A0AAV9EVM2_ACOCL|nr:hypothetical protein QJS10_CPA05g01367 [Acorus calamus]
METNRFRPDALVNDGEDEGREGPALKMDSEGNTLLSAINDTTTNWKIKVKVVRKLSPRLSRNANREFQNVIFEDEKGNMIQGILFNQQIKQFERTILLNHNYYISGAKVQKIAKTFRMVDNEYQLVLQRETKIQEISDENFQPLQQCFNFVSIRNILVVILNVGEKTFVKDDQYFLHNVLVINKESIENEYQLKQIKESNRATVASTSQTPIDTLPVKDEIHDIEKVFNLFEASGKQQHPCILEFKPVDVLQLDVTSKED